MSKDFLDILCADWIFKFNIFKSLKSEGEFLLLLHIYTLHEINGIFIRLSAATRFEKESNT